MPASPSSAYSRKLESEPNVDQALDLLLAYRRGEVDLLQPVHWIPEAAAVLARISPAAAQRDLMDLINLEVPVADSPEIYASPRLRSVVHG